MVPNMRFELFCCLAEVTSVVRVAQESSRKLLLLEETSMMRLRSEPAFYRTIDLREDFNCCNLNMRKHCQSVQRSEDIL